MASPPAGCWARLMSSPATVTVESTLFLSDINSLPSTDSGMQALMSRIEAIIEANLSDGALVLSISNVSFGSARRALAETGGEVSFTAEIGYDSSKTSEDTIIAQVVSAAETTTTTTSSSVVATTTTSVSQVQRNLCLHSRGTECSYYDSLSVRLPPNQKRRQPKQR